MVSVSIRNCQTRESVLKRRPSSNGTDALVFPQPETPARNLSVSLRTENRVRSRRSHLSCEIPLESIGNTPRGQWHSSPHRERIACGAGTKGRQPISTAADDVAVLATDRGNKCDRPTLTPVARDNLPNSWPPRAAAAGLANRAAGFFGRPFAVSSAADPLPKNWRRTALAPMTAKNFPCRSRYPLRSAAHSQKLHANSTVPPSWAVRKLPWVTSAWDTFLARSTNQPRLASIIGYATAVRWELIRFRLVNTSRCTALVSKDSVNPACNR
jgi:hypothetical protein